MKKIFLIVVIIMALTIFHNFRSVEKTIDIDLNVDAKITESIINSKFVNLDFDCANENSGLGDRVCWANISKFNGVPANMIAIFFKSGVNRNVRVSTDRENHGELKSYIDRNFKYVGVSPDSKKEVGQELGVWSTKIGVVSATIDSPPAGEQSIFLWTKK